MTGDTPEIGPHLRQPAGTLSGGQQQMVAIMRGLASDPKILAVDEPCLGLAEAVSRRVYDALARIHQAGPRSSWSRRRRSGR
jgi:ABC-type branched-subunit amino acid transport system ATPase component